MELFNTDQYTTGTSYDFEIQQDSSKKGKRKQPIYDPAWDDGSAFPGIKDTKSAFKEGDSEALPPTAVRLVNPSGIRGVIQKVFSNKCRILWGNGHSADYTAASIKAYGYERVTDEADSPHEDTSSEVSARWNPDHFDPNPVFKAEDEQLTIFLEETGTGEPPEPDDFNSITEYEEAWQQWEISNNWTYVAGSVLASPLPESKLEVSGLSDSQKSIITAQTSLAKDSQKSPTLETCMNLQPLADTVNSQTFLPPLHPANHLASRENDLERTTKETASPPSSKFLSDASPDSLQLKTCGDSSIVPCDQETKYPTLDFSSGSFPAAGMMSNGKLYRVAALALPTLDKGCLWLESPSALSSTGRSPGTTKLESSLIKQGVLSRGQVANPTFLEESFGIPQGWINPWESKAATELLESNEQHLVTHLIQELERSPSQESSICTKSPLYEAPSESNEIPEKFSEETKKDRRRGCLYKYLENKRLKDGTIASYPRVIGDRNPDNPKDWRWGFNWEEKIDGQWRNRSLGCVPVGAIPMIQSMQKSDVPLQEIIDFIRRSKGKKTTE